MFTVTPVQSLSKLVLGNLVKMYKSKGMKITSAASELKPCWVGEEQRGSETLGKPAIVSSGGRKLEASQMLHSSSSRFDPPVLPRPDQTVMEDPRLSDLK